MVKTISLCGNKLDIPSRQCCLLTCGLIVGFTIVIVPVAVFVITPAIAQRIMYTTAIALPNSTMQSCTTAHALMINTAKVHVPGPFTATLRPYKTSITSTSCGMGAAMTDGSCDNPIKTVVGSYMAPEMKLSPGDNDVRFTVGANLTDATALLSGFIVPLFVYGQSAHLTISSEDVDIVAGMNVLGLQINMKVASLKLYNQLTCTQVKIHHKDEPVPIPNWVCHRSEGNHSLDHSPGYEMRCAAGVKTEDSPSSLKAQLWHHARSFLASHKA